MFIYGKCAPFETDVEAVVNKGAKMIELQLTERVHKDIYLKEGIHIGILHPMLNGSDTLSPDAFVSGTRDEEVYYLYNLCKYIKGIQGFTPSIVLHLYDKASIELGVALVEKVDILNQMYGVCPTILIENVLPYDKGDLFRNGHYKEPVKLVNICNQISPSLQFGTCLNIGHAIGTTMVMNLIGNVKISLLDFFKLYAATCRLIRWNDIKNFGLQKGEHSIVVDREFAETLHAFYARYKYKANITIDVIEEDYTDYKNFKTTYDNMKGLFY